MAAPTPTAYSLQPAAATATTWVQLSLSLSWLLPLLFHG
jgi:hypothetical protein